jgi:hypothetical protein
MPGESPIENRFFKAHVALTGPGLVRIRFPFRHAHWLMGLPAGSEKKGQ